MGFPTDSESGAENGPALWTRLLEQSASGPGVFEVHEPTTGHPSRVHDTYGGAEIPAFRRAFVETLRARAVGREVFRITANAFVIVATKPSPSRWSFQYRELEVAIAVRLLQFSERVPGVTG
ncbi:hypothetical protein ACLESD_33355 [Pyxidicoccus sp. 3LFB2]